MKPIICGLLTLFFCLQLHARYQVDFVLNGVRLYWDLTKDEAVLQNVENKQIIWKGSLLPSFWLKVADSELEYVKASVNQDKSMLSEGIWRLAVDLSSLGHGTVFVRRNDVGLSIDSVHIHWKGQISLIHSMYFGMDRMTPEERQVVPSLEYPFWPDWSADGYCIPTAKGAPIQSFFRFWRFGHASIPLGSFGPSLGTPYAAAFPRPIYSAAMGGDAGWVTFGSGTIMDAAMTMQIKASTGCIEYRYREDLWGGYNNQKRTWHKPLLLCWSTSSAWDAYRRFFTNFQDKQPVESHHQLNHWNTWGDFKKGNFDIQAITEQAIDFEAELITWDMSWETFECSGIPDTNRFPDFRNDLDYIDSRNMKVGFWQSVLWVEDYKSLGLTIDDIIVGKNGKPRKVNWLMSPYQTNQEYYALDPSSKRTEEFLINRTQRIVQRYNADLLKLDFGYGIPSPDVGVPRDPALRGENYAYTLLKVISDAAKQVNPDITIQYYSIHPFFHNIQNLLALDDMGDAGNQEAAGHGQWSIWSSLAGMRGMAIMASSGYDWDADAEVLLNTAVVGSPGLVLPIEYNGNEIPAIMKSRRLALGRWYRTTTGWEPLWLNSHKGGLNAEPMLHCWGRIEHFNNGPRLTALALRENNKRDLDRTKINNLDFNGNWAIISQDDASIFASKKLAIIPFNQGSIRMPLKQKPEKVEVVYQDTSKTKQVDWNNGFLEIHVNDHDLKHALVGYMVYSN